MIKRKKIVKVSSLNFEEYDLERDGITQSLLCAFHQCPKAFMFSVNRWSHPSKTRRTGFGSLFHEMLDKTYRYNAKFGVVPSKEKFRKWIDKFELNSSGLLMGKSAREIERDKAIAHVLLVNYVQFYEEDFEKKKFDLVEKKFTIPFHGCLLRGKIDASFLLNERRWLMEHKTKSRIMMDPLLKKLPFDIQLGIYRLALRTITGDKVVGALYNIVRNPGIKRDDIRELRSHLQKEIDKKPEHYFIRSEVPFTKEVQQEFVQELRVKLDFVREIVTGGRPCFRNQTGCTNQFGECEFLDACSSGTMQGYIQKPFLFEELDNESQ